MASGSKIFLCRSQGMHVWPLYVGLFLLCHLSLLSTSRPYIELHPPCIVLRMVRNHFTWFFGRRLVHCSFQSTSPLECRFHDVFGWLLCVDPLWQGGYCYIHGECQTWRTMSCPGVCSLLLICSASGYGLVQSRHLASYSEWCRVSLHYLSFQ